MIKGWCCQPPQAADTEAQLPQPRTERPKLWCAEGCRLLTAAIISSKPLSWSFLFWQKLTETWWQAKLVRITWPHGDQQLLPSLARAEEKSMKTKVVMSSHHKNRTARLKVVQSIKSFILRPQNWAEFTISFCQRRPDNYASGSDKKAGLGFTSLVINTQISLLLLAANMLEICQ